MSPTISIASVRKSLVVKASPQRAFDVFTNGINRWWPCTHGIGTGPIRRSVIEPSIGGRWYTEHEDGSEATVGHVRAWQPGALFTVSWEISSNWKPDARVALASEVEVRFTEQADGQTRVDLEHRNFERMGEAEGSSMRGAVDNGWPGLLAAYAGELQRATP